MTAATARKAEPLDDLTVRRAQRGDEQAWRALIARHQQPVHALIWRLLAGRARHRVEDLVQETFVRVLRALPSFDLSGPASLTSWIFTIATRLALNELRQPPPVAAAAPDEVPAGDRADHQAERHRLAAAIAACVAALPEAQRAVLVLREYHDLAYDEIAGILELDLGTVKSRLARARLALREALIARVPESVPARHADPQPRRGRHGAR